MMKFFTVKLTFPILFLLVFGIVQAQIPTGGTILNATSGTTYQKVGKGTLTQVNVEGQSFTKALRYTTGTDILNFWDAQILFPSVAGIAANDVILVAFYARTISSVQETGEGSVTIIIEHKTTYAKEISTKLMIGREWKQYYVSVKSKVNWSVADIRYALFTGFNSQSIEVADVQFINYKNSLTLADLPVTEITYFGQAPDAEWRTAAS
jgi:endo-1,4-beta-xylanase